MDERGLPIPEALVWAGRARAHTDEHGCFDLSEIVEEQSSLSISAEGYADATYFHVKPGSRLTIGLVHAVRVKIKVLNLGAEPWNGVHVELGLTQAWGNPKLSAESGQYGLGSKDGGELDVRPGCYCVSVKIGEVRVAEVKGLEFAPADEPCLVVDCKGIDWATLVKAADLVHKGFSLQQEYTDKVLRAKKEDREPIWEEMRSKLACITEEIRRLQEEFDKSPPPRVELRHRVDDF